MAEYENKFGLMRQELERVNINLKNKADEGNGLGEKLRLCLQEN